MKYQLTAAAMFAATIVSVPASAAVFDLESLPHPGSTGFTTYAPATNYDAIAPSLSQPSQQGPLTQTVAGLTLSLATDPYVFGTSPGITNVALFDPSFYSFNGVPASNGHVAFFAYGTNAPIYANFSDAISDFSVQAFRTDGTFFPTVTLTAYSGANGTGSVLGTQTATFGGTGYQSTIISLSGLSGAGSVAILGSSSGTVNFDNIVANISAPVPEAATWAMMIAGFGMVGGVMRRRTAKTAITYA